MPQHLARRHASRVGALGLTDVVTGIGCVACKPGESSPCIGPYDDEIVLRHIFDTHADSEWAVDVMAVLLEA
jgi:hypothetical protein